MRHESDKKYIVTYKTGNMEHGRAAEIIARTSEQVPDQTQMPSKETLVGSMHHFEEPGGWNL